MPRAKTVAEYIAKSPPAACAKLRALRAAIKAAAPRAEERISYGMPYYAYHGRLAYFARHRNHIGLYVPRAPNKMRRELAAYIHGKSTVRFSLTEKLPIALIKRLVRTRRKMNEGA